MAVITYDHDEFKSIDCIPEYAAYTNIYVARTPHVDETGHSFQVINTAWGHQKITHPIAVHEVGSGYLQVPLPPSERETGVRVNSPVSFGGVGPPTKKLSNAPGKSSRRKLL